MLTTHERENLKSEAQECLVELGEVSRETKGPWIGGLYDGGGGYWPSSDQ